MPPDVGAIGTTGQIQPCNECKVVDVPEMGVSPPMTSRPSNDALACPSIPARMSPTLGESEWFALVPCGPLTRPVDS